MEILQILLISFVVLINQMDAKIYLENNGPLQLGSPINIKDGFSFKFRTCSSGILLQQGSNMSYFRITLHPTSSSKHGNLVLSWKENSTIHQQSLENYFSLDKNSLVEVEVLITKDDKPIFRTISPVHSNSTISNTSSLQNLSNNGPLLLGLKNFTGCLYAGKNVNLSTALSTSKFQNGCPLEDQRLCTNRVCPAGFAGRYCNNNINECGSYPCHSHATCVDDINNYKCICGPRWTGRTCSTFLGSLCNSSSLCQNGGVCLESKDRNNYTCFCQQGYTGRNCESLLYPCTLRPCQNNATCYDYAVGSSLKYNCTCKSGFTGIHCEYNIDNCLSHPCLSGKCIDGINNYTCDCSGSGYQGRNCEKDINECNTLMPCKNNGTCNNIYGGYKCTCRSGFQGATCQTDVQECNLSPCQNNGTCVEKYGAYHCNCTAGFIGKHCEVNVNDCSANICGSHGTCIDGINSYTCNCSAGFTGKHCSVNTNECSSNPCQNNGTCVDGINGYTCKCLGAFNGTHCEIWTDRCKPSPCINNGTCINRNYSVAGYECNCTGTGYAGPNCQFIPGLCYPHDPCMQGQCRDYGSFYNCTCNAGYKGINCSVDIDECTSTPCKHGGTCKNQPGSYKCTCLPYSTGVNCEIDVFRCDPPCLNGGQCSNKNYTRDHCLCGSPWIGDACEKRIDFCAQDKRFCGNGSCVNVYGDTSRSTCVCHAGYYGKSCMTDIDECKLGYCVNNVSCSNLNGDYRCSCLPGFTNKNCSQNVNECLSNPCLNNGTCTDGINAYNCSCRYGYNGSNCENDINWCLSSPCQNGGNCTDGIETFNCSCHLGFRGKSCQIDVNECISNPCKFGGICIENSNVSRLPNNNRHGYQCVCPAGTNGTNCQQNIDDCASSPCANNGTCHDQLNDYNCSCARGFTGKNCSININECASNPCQNNATCVDQIAGYNCTCKKDYHGLHCENATNQCLIKNPCNNGGTCYQIGISYGCKCASGFTGKNCEKPTTMNFNANGFLTINSTTTTAISFDFRSTVKTGLICEVIARAKSVFIGLEDNGLIVKDSIGLQSSIKHDVLNNGLWHNIVVVFNAANMTFKIGGKLSSVSFGVAGIIKFSFGAMNSSTVMNKATFPDLIGCIRDLKLGDLSIDPAAEVTTGVSIGGCQWKQLCSKTPCENEGKCTDLWSTYSCKCNRRFYGSQCNQAYDAFTFGSAFPVQPLPTSKPSNTTNRRRRSLPNTSNQANQTDYVLSLVNTTFNGTTTVALSLRTRAENGIIFVLANEAPKQGVASVQSYVTLQLVSGKLYYKFNYSTDFRSADIPKMVNDGVWHDIEVSKSNVTVDGALVYSPSVTTDLPVKFIYIGGVDNTTFFGKALKTADQYRGCLQAFTFQGATISSQPLSGGGLAQPVNTSTAKTGCNSTDVCAAKPCQNNGNCTDLWNVYKCTCPVGYSGDNCTLFGCAVQNNCPKNQSCVDLKAGATTCISPFTFNGSESSATFASLTINNASLISFKLRTRRSESFILGSGNSTKSFLAVGLNLGRIRLHYWFIDMPVSASITSSLQVNDGNLHSIEINLSSKTTIQIDSKSDVSNHLNSSSNNWNSLLKFTGLSVGKTSKSFITNNFRNISYKGCLEKLMIGQRLLQLNESSNVGVRNGCHSDNPCTQGTCQHAGRCVDTFDSFKCVCPAHYTGSTCNSTVNVTCAFAPSPCVQNSTCVNLTSPVTRRYSDAGMDMFRCDCKAGYTGYFCGTNIDECSPNPCVNGSCTDLIADYRCTCNRGYTGKNCSIDIDECQPNPCMNGGSCADHVNDYTCSCVNGYTGRNCTEDVNECLQSPCKNNATCLNDNGGYNCTCLNGSFGNNCQFNASMSCLSNPCQNNGTCTADNAGYKCKCQTGFSGSQCQLDTNPCGITNLCANNGACVPILSQCPSSTPNCVRTYVSYNCSCSGPWTGKNCGYINPCANNPCKNGGTCSVLNTTATMNYSCQCTSEYQDTDCQTKKTVEQKDKEINVGMWIGIAAACLVVMLVVLLACRFCKGEQGMHGVYSPSRQEKGQVEMSSLPPLPPKERLI